MNNCEDWSIEIGELETFFADKIIPKEPLYLDKATKITDLKIFVESHLSVVKHNNGKRTFLPYLERLQKVKKILTEAVREPTIINKVS